MKPALEFLADDRPGELNVPKVHWFLITGDIETFRSACHALQNAVALNLVVLHGRHHDVAEPGKSGGLRRAGDAGHGGYRAERQSRVLQKADIDLSRVAPEDFSASAAIHGTAVAAILVGDPSCRVPGLLPGLPPVAVNAFHKAGRDERADAFTLVRALDRLSQSGSQVINFSLAG